MERQLRILYVGMLDEENRGTCTHRLKALTDLGHECLPVNSVPLQRSLFRRIRSGVRRVLLNSWYDPVVNRTIRTRIRSWPADIVWLDKAISVSPETLAVTKTEQPHMKVVGYSPDDMMNPNNQSREFLKGLPFYDFYFTTKSYNVAELEALGCPRAVFVPNAFHPAVHRPIPMGEEERRRIGAKVGFIGAAEAERVSSLAHLAANGIEVKVWGDHWAAWRRRLGPGVLIAGPSQWGLDYAKVICSCDINLCFLRKVNRDLQTTRSVEIPACGGFMLAERTQEHLELFKEGEEAEFFGSNEELLDKVRYYMAHVEERRRIAAAGRERCVRAGYSNHDRLRRLLKLVVQEGNEERVRQ